MEAAFYIFVAALLCIGPVLGFVFGVKCCAGWFGIELHHGDTMQVLDWDETPEVYKPRPADDAPAADQAAQEGPEDGLQGEGLPTGKMEPEAAVDALLAALDAARVPLAQLMKGTEDFAEAVEAYGDGAAVSLNGTASVEITLEPEEPAADEAAAPAAPAGGGPV